MMKMVIVNMSTKMRLQKKLRKNKTPKTHPKKLKMNKTHSHRTLTREMTKKTMKVKIVNRTLTLRIHKIQKQTTQTTPGTRSTLPTRLMSTMKTPSLISSLAFND